MISFLVTLLSPAWDSVRWVNLGLLLLIVVGLIANLVARREKINRRTRRIMVWIIAIFINFLYGTADNLQDSIRVNPAVILATILLLGLTGAIIWHPDGDDQLPPNDNSLTTRALEWLDERVKQYKAERGGNHG